MGALAGLGFALVWFATMAWLARAAYPNVVRWRLPDILRLKEMFPSEPDVLGWERNRTLQHKQA